MQEIPGRFKAPFQCITKDCVRARDSPEIRSKNSHMTDEIDEETKLNIVKVVWIREPKRLRGKIDDGNWITLYIPENNLDCVRIVTQPKQNQRDRVDRAMEAQIENSKKSAPRAPVQKGIAPQKLFEIPKNNKQIDGSKLTDVFDIIDMDNDGIIHMQDFKRIISDPNEQNKKIQIEFLLDTNFDLNLMKEIYRTEMDFGEFQEFIIRDLDIIHLPSRSGSNSGFSPSEWEEKFPEGIYRIVQGDRQARDGPSVYSKKTNNYKNGSTIELVKIEVMDEIVRGQLINGDWITIYDISGSIQCVKPASEKQKQAYELERQEIETRARNESLGFPPTVKQDLIQNAERQNFRKELAKEKNAQPKKIKVVKKKPVAKSSPKKITPAGPSTPGKPTPKTIEDIPLPDDEAMAKVFDLLDQDNSGDIDFKEIVSGLESQEISNKILEIVGMPLKVAAFRQLEGNDEIEYDDLKESVLKYIEDQKKLKKQKEVAQTQERAMRALDAKSINLDEMLKNYTPGEYTLEIPAIGRPHFEIGNTNSKRKDYEANLAIKVVEVKYLEKEKRLRGKLSDGMWITLVNVDDYRFYVKKRKDDSSRKKVKKQPEPEPESIPNNLPQLPGKDKKKATSADIGKLYRTHSGREGFLTDIGEDEDGAFGLILFDDDLDDIRNIKSLRSETGSLPWSLRSSDGFEDSLFNLPIDEMNALLNMNANSSEDASPFSNKSVSFSATNDTRIIDFDELLEDRIEDPNTFIQAALDQEDNYETPELPEVPEAEEKPQRTDEVRTKVLKETEMLYGYKPSQYQLIDAVIVRNRPTIMTEDSKQTNMVMENELIWIVEVVYVEETFYDEDDFEFVTRKRIRGRQKNHTWLTMYDIDSDTKYVEKFVTAKKAHFKVPRAGSSSVYANGMDTSSSDEEQQQDEYENEEDIFENEPASRSQAQVPVQRNEYNDDEDVNYKSRSNNGNDEEEEEKWDEEYMPDPRKDETTKVPAKRLSMRSRFNQMNLSRENENNRTSPPANFENKNEEKTHNVNVEEPMSFDEDSNDDDPFVDRTGSARSQQEFTAPDLSKNVSEVDSDTEVGTNLKAPSRPPRDCRTLSGDVAFAYGSGLDEQGEYYEIVKPGSEVVELRPRASLSFVELPIDHAPTTQHRVEFALPPHVDDVEEEAPRKKKVEFQEPIEQVQPVKVKKEPKKLADDASDDEITTEAIRKVFDYVDRDSSKTITIEEFVQVLYLTPQREKFEKLLGTKLNINMFRDIDKDSSRSIDFPEFESYLKTKLNEDIGSADNPNRNEIQRKLATLDVGIRSRPRQRSRDPNLPEDTSMEPMNLYQKPLPSFDQGTYVIVQTCYGRTDVYASSKKLTRIYNIGEEVDIQFSMKFEAEQVIYGKLRNGDYITLYDIEKDIYFAKSREKKRLPGIYAEMNMDNDYLNNSGPAQEENIPYNAGMLIRDEMKQNSRQEDLNTRSVENGNNKNLSPLEYEVLFGGPVNKPKPELTKLEEAVLYGDQSTPSRKYEPDYFSDKKSSPISSSFSSPNSNLNQNPSPSEKKKQRFVPFAPQYGDPRYVSTINRHDTESFSNAVNDKISDLQQGLKQIQETNEQVLMENERIKRGLDQKHQEIDKLADQIQDRIARILQVMDRLDEK